MSPGIDNGLCFKRFGKIPAEAFKMAWRWIENAGGLLQAASCAGPYTTPCPSDAEESPAFNPWVLRGALVSGLTRDSDAAFVDQREQPDVRVSIEYNAGFTGNYFPTSNVKAYRSRSI